MGDQSGIVACHLTLGLLAHESGDLAAAAAHYARASTVADQCGNLVDSCIIETNLGLLRTDQDRDPEAVGHHATALAIRLRLDLPDKDVDAEALYQLRNRLGRTRFEELAREQLDTESVVELTGILDVRPS